MAIDDTSLMSEISLILSKSNPEVSNRWSAWLTVTVEGQGDQVITPLAVTTVDIERDYAGSYGDHVYVEMTFGAGTFTQDVYPYKNNLQLTLVKNPLGEVVTDADLSADSDVQIFYATLVEDMSAVIAGYTAAAQDKAAADLSSILTVQFQCVDLTLNQLRMRSTGGIVRGATALDTIRYLLTVNSQEVDVAEVNKIRGVTAYPSDNAGLVDNLVLEHGIPVVDVPEFINDNVSGVYSTGFGYYLQRYFWYLYPLYDLKRFDTDPRALTLINVPKNRFPQVERTYRTTANQVIAMITGEVKHLDLSEQRQLNEGNGVRFTDASKMIDGFAEVKDNKALALRSMINNEYMTESRPSGLNNVKLSDKPITSNTFVESSKLARRQGARIVCTWENCDPDLIYPGMPVTYMYTVNDQVVALNGVVHRAQYNIAMSRPGVTNPRHICNCALTLFVDKQINWPNE